jgi:uncharacterized protein YjeT (DUF2065 family)
VYGLRVVAPPTGATTVVEGLKVVDAPKAATVVEGLKVVDAPKAATVVAGEARASTVRRS